MDERLLSQLTRWDVNKNCVLLGRTCNVMLSFNSTQPIIPGFSKQPQKIKFIYIYNELFWCFYSNTWGTMQTGPSRFRPFVACQLCACGRVILQVLSSGLRWWFVDLSDTDWTIKRISERWRHLPSLQLWLLWWHDLLIYHISHLFMFVVIISLYTQWHCRHWDGFVVWIFNYLTTNYVQYPAP